MRDDKIIDFVLAGVIILVVILKLLNIITVSWLILLMPAIILCGGMAIVLGVYIGFVVIIELIDFIRRRKR